MIPTYFAGLVLISGLFARGDARLGWFMFWALFGASAAFQLPALGGASVSPAVAFLPFLMVTSLRRHGIARWLQQCRDGEPGFWLLMIVVWGVVGALFLPRLFAGEVDVLTTDRLAADGEPALRIAPLRPVSTNLSQSAYAIGALATFLSVRSLCRMPQGFAAFERGILVLAAANVAAALVNMAELYLGMPSILDLVRNGGYAILNQSGIAGLQRLYGTFPEASSFAGFTLPLFAATLSLWRSGTRPRLSAALAAALGLLLLVSTSSTAYAGLMLYGTAAAALVAWRALAGGHDRSAAVLVGIAALAVAAVAIVGIVRPQVFGPILAFFEITLFDKLESSSGMERGSWNLQAWNNFVETSGMGVGLGSARASSFALVLLSNVGAIGTGLFVLFLMSVYLRPAARPASREVTPVVIAARHAVFAGLVVACLSATVFDLGVSFYAWAAVACGFRRESKGRVLP